jgi:hypothetical protein
VNAELSVPSDSGDLPFSLRDYKSWDLVRLTQRYLQLLLRLLCEPDSDAGVLLHCISGWDRTPLLISLLRCVVGVRRAASPRAHTRWPRRISLWADGEAHESLSAEQLLFLTIAYDWMLFHHQLPDRMAKGEDVFHFCFHFLEFITSDEFSVHFWDEWIARRRAAPPPRPEPLARPPARSLLSHALAARKEDAAGVGADGTAALCSPPEAAAVAAATATTSSSSTGSAELVDSDADAGGLAAPPAAAMSRSSAPIGIPRARQRPLSSAASSPLTPQHNSGSWHVVDDEELEAMVARQQASADEWKAAAAAAAPSRGEKAPAPAPAPAAAAAGALPADGSREERRRARLLQVQSLFFRVFNAYRSAAQVRATGGSVGGLVDVLASLALRAAGPSETAAPRSETEVSTA